MFQSFNESGSLQIENLASYAYRFVNKGSFGCQDRYAGSDIEPLYLWTDGSSNKNQASDLVAVACSTHHAAVILSPFTPASFPANYICGSTERVSNDPYNPGSSTINWWGFNAMWRYTPSTSGVGIQMMDAAGKLTYESTSNILKVVHSQSFSGSLSTGSTTLAAGKTYAAVPFGTPRVASYAIGVKISGASISWKPVQWPGSSPTSTNGGFLIVDVTGF